MPMAPHGRTQGTPAAQGDPSGTLRPRGWRGGGETPACGARVMPRTGPAHTCGDGSEQVHVAPTHGPPWPHPGRPRGPEGPPRYTESAGGVGGGETPAHGARVMPHLGPRTDMAMATYGGIMVRNPPPRPPGGGGQAQGGEGGRRGRRGGTQRRPGGRALARGLRAV